VNEQPFAAEPLAKRMVHAKRRTWHHVFIIHIGHDANDALGRGIDWDELHHWIGPHQVMVHRILIRKHTLGHALAHDNDRFASVPIPGVEIAASDDRHAERREESGRHRPVPSEGILFARRLDMAVRGKFEPGSEDASVAPRNRAPYRDSFDTRQLRYSPDRFLIVLRDLFGRLSGRHVRHIDGEHVTRVEAGLGGLQCDQSFYKHAGACQQYE
jgi:hypothetical protein